MTHILFDGDIRRHPALRSLFWQWGVTVGEASSAGGDGSRPTVEECDAVVRAVRTGTNSGTRSCAMPDGAEEEGAAASAAAPLLVIGPEDADPQAWVSIPDPGPGGSLLQAALRSCVERSGFLRGDPVSRRDRDRFRDFLGHELRTPLTAIQTALAILQNDPQLGAGPARMLGIARRNLVRLAETVEWSQELEALAEKAPVPELGWVGPRELARVLEGRLTLDHDPLDDAEVLFTDPGLLGTLAGQMERVLSYACPGCEPAFVLSFDAASGQGILAVRAAAPKDRPALPSRTGAGSPESDPAAWDRAEFRNLARLMVSPQLLQVLGARMRATTAADCFELLLELPTVQAAPVPAPDSVSSV